MKSINLGLALAFVASLTMSIAGAWSREGATPPPREGAAAGPARPDSATSGAYEIGAGDVLSVGLTFKPAAAESQLIQPGDQLTASWHFGLPPIDKVYTAEPGDHLFLRFPYSGDLSQPYLVHPDGTIMLYSLGESLNVMGKSMAEITKIVKEKHKTLLKNPEVAVTVDPQYLHDKPLMAIVHPGFPRPNLTVTVPPDGLISLPLLPSLKASGKTIQKLSENLTAHYRGLNYRFTTVNVWFEKIADERNSQLRDLLAGKANPLRCEVPPGGQIALPLIPRLSVAGKSLDQVSAELTEKYHQRGLDRVEATVWIEKPRGRTVRVLGEVQSRGVYPLSGSADLWGVIAQAGGFTPDADSTAVRVLKNGNKKGPFDLEKYQETGESVNNPTLSGDELIFVPKKK